MSPALAADRVQEALDALHADHGFPGASVARAGGDGVEQMRATGWAATARCMCI
ncbi:MAG: hypothetical protein JJU42_04130 [Rhodobacteraceae bacterium]|nr:hypothetical protein [Paracoccaceae bacterium]